MNKLIKQAFTLIELLVVIAIIGILSGLIVVAMSGVTNKASIAKAQVFSNSLRNVLMINTLGEWKLDEISGTAANDTWGGLNNGTIYGFADTTAGWGDTHTSGWMSSSNCVSGTCLKLDGTDDYIGIPTLTALRTGDYTISLWFKDAGDTIYVISPAVNVTAAYLFPHIRVTSTSIWIQRNANGSLGFPFSFDAKWHNLVFTRANGLVTGYLDGISKGVLTGTYDQNGYDFTDTAFYMGQFYYSGTHYFKSGQLDDTRIFNAAIPASQIKEQYYSGLNDLLFSGKINKEEYQNKIVGIR